MTRSSKRRRPRRSQAPSRRRSLGPDEWVRARVVALVGETTIEAAFAERQLIDQLPASVWRQFESFLERLLRLKWDDRSAFCATQSELMRRLIVLLALDTTNTMRVIRAKLG